MAKRKRLSPALAVESPELETKSALGGWQGGANRSRAPIADVAGTAAAEAALTELADEMETSRREGRLIITTPLDRIDETYLVRDRLVLDEDEMNVLMTSLAERGQQVPLELADLGEGRYGLISGWRRLTALRRLHEETQDDRFANALAVLRQPSEAGEAYRAMVEENEIRAGLSYYERAQIAVRAAEAGAFANVEEAVRRLYSAVSRPKRSKIRSFVTIYEKLDASLAFPSAIPERLGLALVKAIADDPRVTGHLAVTLSDAGPQTPYAERKVIETFLSRKHPVRASIRDDKRARDETVAPGLRVKRGAERLTLTGPAVNEELYADLLAWLKQR